MRSFPSAVSRMRSQDRAEGLGHRVDEADLAGAVGEPVPLGGRRRLRRDLDERPVLLDQSPDLAAREDVVLFPGLVGVERHELDEAHDVGLAAGQLGQRGHLLLGEAANRHAVDLDRPQLGIALGLGQPGQHLVERVAPRDLGEADVRERVERDVQPAQPRFDERTAEAVEEDAVRRQREVVDARDRGQHRDEGREVAPSEGLAAGQPDLRHAHAGEHSDETRHLLEREELVATEPLESLGGHAVPAPKVALVGDRHAHAGDLAIPRIDERLHAGEPSVRFRQAPRGGTTLVDRQMFGGIYRRKETNDLCPIGNRKLQRPRKRAAQKAAATTPAAERRRRRHGWRPGRWRRLGRRRRRYGRRERLVTHCLLVELRKRPVGRFRRLRVARAGKVCLTNPSEGERNRCRISTRSKGELKEKEGEITRRRDP